MGGFNTHRVGRGGNKAPESSSSSRKRRRAEGQTEGKKPPGASGKKQNTELKRARKKPRGRKREKMSLKGMAKDPSRTNRGGMNSEEGRRGVRRM